VDPHLPVVVVGAVSEPFREGTTTIIWTDVLKDPAALLSWGVDYLAIALDKAGGKKVAPEKGK